MGMTNRQRHSQDSARHVHLILVRAATNESQKTRNKNQETKRFSTFAVFRLRHSETKKTTLQVFSETCETANQQSISSHMVVYIACKMRCR